MYDVVWMCVECVCVMSVGIENQMDNDRNKNSYVPMICWLVKAEEAAAIFLIKVC